jgi:hypothetical protein
MIWKYWFEKKKTNLKQKKKNQKICYEIRKKFKLKKRQEQLKIKIKRTMTIFYIKIKCQEMKSKDKLIQ